MQIVLSYLVILRRFGRSVGPYLMIEMLLPGGTLLALLVYLARRRKLDLRKRVPEAVPALIRTLASVFAPRVLAPVPIEATIRMRHSGSAGRR